MVQDQASRAARSRGMRHDPDDDVALPKLRHIDTQPIVHDGRPSLYLRDPLQLTDITVVVPYVLGPLLAMLDGSRSRDAARAALAVQLGADVGREPIDRLVSALDDALLLDNDRSRLAAVRALEAYRSAPCRPASLAGVGYPADPDALRALFDGHLADAAPEVPSEVPADAPVAANCVATAARSSTRSVRGVISPHIDYHRGGPTYAKVWRRAEDAAREADLVVILGTDHNGRSGSITLTMQPYCTPFGTLPAATEAIDALVEALGEERCFAGELNHRAEHSVELSAVWLHHMRGGAPVPMLPVLCGSFGGFLEGGTGPRDDDTIELFVDTMTQVVSQGSALVVASADLSHVGPAFGGEPIDRLGGASVRMSDGRLLAPVLDGDASGFIATWQSIGDRTNVCGVPPIYLMLRLLASASGELLAYDTCPADDRGTSLVSVCGAVLG